MAQEPYNPVPTVEPTGPARQYENINPSPADFGGLIGQATERAGQAGEQAAGAASQVAIELQNRQNQIISNDAFNQYQKQLLNITQGDPNDTSGPGGKPRPGYLALQGQAALVAQPDVEKSIDQARMNIMSGLNSAQQVQFAQDSRRLQMFTLDTVRTHFIRQQNVYGQSVNVAGQQTAERAIASYAGDITPQAEQAFQDNLSQLRRNAVQEVQLQGNSNDPNIVNNALDIANQKAIVSRLQAIIAKDPINGPAKASEWLENGQLHDMPVPGQPQTSSPVKNHLEPNVLLSWENHLKEVKEGLNVDAAVHTPPPGYGPDPAAPGGASPNPSAGPRVGNPEVSGAIGPAAARAGIPEDQLRTIAHIESGTGAAKDRPGSQYTGPFQLGTVEKASVGIQPGDSLAVQTDKSADFVKRAYDKASETVGYPAQGWQTYLVHQQGVGGGPALLKADPNDNAVNVLAAAGVPHAVANIAQNGGSADTTVGQFLQHWQDVYARKAQEVGVSPTTMTATEAMANLRTRGFNITPLPTSFPNNFNAAAAALDMTPQEQNLYQHHLDNLNSEGKVTQPNGDISTVLQSVVTHNGLFYNIPLVWDGKTLTPDDAAKRVGAQGWQNWPAYATADAADARYAQMHTFMDKDTANYLRGQVQTAPAASALQPAAYTPASGGQPSPQQTPGTMPSSPLHSPQGYLDLANYYSAKEAQMRQLFGNNPTAYARAMTAVKQDIEFRRTLYTGAQAEAQKAQHDNLDSTVNQIVTAVGNSLMPGYQGTPLDYGKLIFNNPAFDGPGGGEAKKIALAFTEEQLQRAGKGPLYGYSSGFNTTYHDIVSGPDEPGHITNAAEILKRGGPGGSLSFNETKELMGVYKDMALPDKASTHIIADGFQRDALTQLLFKDANTSDTPQMHLLEDPQGKHIYNTQFLPWFRHGLDAAVASGDQKQVDNWLSDKNVTAKVQSLRSDFDKNKALLNALGEDSTTLPEAPNTPLPTAPKGVNPDGWATLMGQLPNTHGKTWAHAPWGGVLGQLLQDSKDPKEREGAFQDFNEKFGNKMGLDAEHVVSLLNGAKPVPAAPGAQSTNAAPADTHRFTPREQTTRDPNRVPLSERKGHHFDYGNNPATDIPVGSTEAGPPPQGDLGSLIRQPPDDVIKQAEANDAARLAARRQHLRDRTQ